VSKVGTRVAVVVLFFMPALAGCAKHYSTGAAPLGNPPSGAAAGPTSVTYCAPGGLPQQLDLYRPRTTPRGGSPVAVWVHGGGWAAGDSAIPPDSLPGMIEASLVNRGWTFASINYRLAPQSRWPAQIEDTKCAIRYLRQRAGPLGLNRHRIAALGASAGGHLVSLVGLAGPKTGFDVGQFLNQSSAVQAVVDMSGPADLTTPDWASSPVGLMDAGLVFGVGFGQASPTLVKASPVTYVRRGTPPFLIIQGDHDGVVPPGQSNELAQHLQAAGDTALLVMVKNGGHGYEQAGPGPVKPTVDQLVVATVLFLDRYVGGPGSAPTIGGS
jgi:acetyl esterase/lipase